jgi:hypothetical protein
MHTVRFQVLTAASLKMTVFWDVESCKLIETDRRFRGVYCLISVTMEAINASEMSANFYKTIRRNISEDGHLENAYRYTLKRHKNAVSIADVI